MQLPHCTLIISACLVLSHLTSDVVAETIRLPAATLLTVDHRLTVGTTFPGYFINDQVALADGGATLNDFHGTWQAGDTIIARIEAQAGYRVQLTPHPNTQSTGVVSQVLFYNGGGPGLDSPATIRFENPIGMAPTIDDLEGVVGDAGSLLGYAMDFMLEESFSFTAFEVEFIASSSGALAIPVNKNVFITVSAADYFSPLPDALLLQILSVPEPSTAVLFMFSCVNLLAVRKLSKA